MTTLKWDEAAFGPIDDYFPASESRSINSR